MLKQKIKSEPGSGKTTLLLSVANGAPDDINILLILPTEGHISIYRDIYNLKRAELMSYTAAVVNGKLKLNKYDMILLDNCEGMVVEGGGDPVDIVCEMNKHLIRPIVVIGAYSIIP